MVDPGKGTWRYKPLEGDRQAYHYGAFEDDEFFDVVYDPLLMPGIEKPQELAKFTKALLDAKFDSPLASMKWRYDEETGTLHSASQQKLTDTLDHVDIDLGLVASWARDQEAPPDGWPNEDLETAHWVGLRKTWQKGDIQVAEIFLASGILDPLQRLSNTRSWCIELTAEDLSEEPPCIQERMALDVSNAITHKLTELCDGHNSNVVPCGLLWKPMMEPLSNPLLYQT
ncbi:MAG: hypothetical protein ASARMPREDX12_008220 [Alectoria sarmentosa]|nr:MAG: hypothetical protein ASARMPREDX12_008220 [Alectoria sarmentosa]